MRSCFVATTECSVAIANMIERDFTHSTVLPVRSLPVNHGYNGSHFAAGFYRYNGGSYRYSIQNRTAS